MRRLCSCVSDGYMVVPSMSDMRIACRLLSIGRGVGKPVACSACMKVYSLEVAMRDR